MGFLPPSLLLLFPSSFYRYLEPPPFCSLQLPLSDRTDSILLRGQQFCSIYLNTDAQITRSISSLGKDEVRVTVCQSVTYDRTHEQIMIVIDASASPFYEPFSRGSIGATKALGNSGQ